MKVGFTGTQRGMTEEQKQEFRNFISCNTVEEFHHGDCIGADKDAHDIAISLGISIVIHPPLNPVKRAFCSGAIRVLDKKPYLDRNKEIVRDTDILMATPGEVEEQLRSGTWSTIRFASRQNKALFVIGPFGNKMLDNGLYRRF